MKAILVYPGHALWEACCNTKQAYNYTVVILTDREDDVLEYIDTSTEMAARTVLDAVNIGIISDWRQLYG